MVGAAVVSLLLSRSYVHARAFTLMETEARLFGENAHWLLGCFFFLLFLLEHRAGQQLLLPVATMSARRDAGSFYIYIFFFSILCLFGRCVSVMERGRIGGCRTGCNETIDLQWGAQSGIGFAIAVMWQHSRVNDRRFGAMSLQAKHW